MLIIDRRTGAPRFATFSLPETSLDAVDGNPEAADAAALIIPNDADVALHAAAIRRAAAVVLELPVFSDGRAYSQARILRDRLGYSGLVVARGDILVDQAQFLLRAGFNGFELDEPSADLFLKMSRQFTVFYQKASDRALAIAELRLARRDAA